MLGCNSTIVVSKVLHDVGAHSALTNGFQQGIPSKEKKHSCNLGNSVGCFSWVKKVSDRSERLNAKVVLTVSKV